MSIPSLTSDAQPPNASTHPERPAPASRSAGLVLFDWNGTVMDDLARAAAAANQALARFGLAALSEEEFQLGFTLPLRHWLSGLGIPDEHTADAAEDWNRAMEVHAPARSAARETLTTLRASGVITGIVTAAAPASVRADIRANGLEGLFAEIHTDVDDKTACLRSLRHLGDPAIYVGDTAYDIDSARAAGYITVSIAGGYQHASLLARSEPDHHIDDLARVLTLGRPPSGE